MWETMLLSTVIFLVCAVGMGIGMIFSNRTKSMQRGTCGGTPLEVDGIKMTCSTCPNRDQPGHRVGPSKCANPSASTFEN
jgi:hypothetical protein